MAQSTNSRAEEMKIERKEQIMRAALSVFAYHGIKLTKVSMIAKEASVSHGLVYHYFTSKEEVLYESIKWAVGMDKTHHFLQHLSDSHDSPLEKIEKFTKYAFSTSDSVSSHIFKIIQDMDKTEGIPNNVKDFADNLGKMYFEFLIPIMEEGQKSGQIIDEDAEELTAIFLTIISGIMADDVEFWQENMDRKVDIFLRMFVTR